MKLFYKYVNNKQYIIKLVDDKFLVGSLDRCTKVFKPICSCEFYYQAYLVIEALKKIMRPRKYFYRGVDLWPEVTGRFLKRIVRTGLPG